MRWEPVSHETQWQRHGALRNSSSVLSIYTVVLPSYQLGKLWEEGGKGWSTPHMEWSQLGSHLPPNHSCDKNTTIFYNFLWLGRTNKPIFFFYLPIQYYVFIAWGYTKLGGWGGVLIDCYLFNILKWRKWENKFPSGNLEREVQYVCINLFFTIET